MEGIKNARGEIVCFLEDDDLFSSDKLSTLTRIFGNRPELSFVHNGWKIMGESAINGLKSPRTIKKELSLQAFEASYSIYKIARFKVYWNVSSMSVRRRNLSNFLEAISQINITVDFALFLFSLFSNGEVMLLPDILTFYRMHQLSLTSGSGRSPEVQSSIAERAIHDNGIIKKGLPYWCSENLKERIDGDLLYWRIKLLGNSHSCRKEMAKLLLTFFKQWGFRAFLEFRLNVVELIGALIYILSPSLSSRLAFL